MDVCPAGMEGSLYWQWMQNTKPKGADKASPYKMLKDEAMKEKISLEEELDTKSVFNPLAPSSQLSEAPSLQPCDEASPESDAAGPKTPLHFSETPISIPPFDVSILGIPNKSAALSLLQILKNALFNLAPGSPVKGVGLSIIGHVNRITHRHQLGCCPQNKSQGTHTHTVKGQTEFIRRGRHGCHDGEHPRPPAVDAHIGCPWKTGFEGP